MSKLRNLRAAELYHQNQLLLEINNGKRPRERAKLVWFTFQSWLTKYQWRWRHSAWYPIRPTWVLHNHPTLKDDKKEEVWSDLEILPPIIFPSNSDQNDRYKTIWIENDRRRYVWFEPLSKFDFWNLNPHQKFDSAVPKDIPIESHVLFIFSKLLDRYSHFNSFSFDFLKYIKFWWRRHQKKRKFEWDSICDSRSHEKKIDRNMEFLTLKLDALSEFTLPSDLIHFIVILISQNIVSSRNV
jgi:hypothetical protein